MTPSAIARQIRQLEKYEHGKGCARGFAARGREKRVFYVGIMMLIAGVAEVIRSFQIKTWGRFLFWLALGVVYIVAGFDVVANPLHAAVWLTFLLGLLLIISGVTRIFLGLSMKTETPWVRVVASGVITALINLVILAHWPVSSLWALGIFLGVDLVFAGATWIGMGMDLKRTTT